jgi:hypothetical protein
VGVSTRNSAPRTGDSRPVQARTSGAQTCGVRGSRARDIVSDPLLNAETPSKKEQGSLWPTYGGHHSTRCILQRRLESLAAPLGLRRDKLIRLGHTELRSGGVDCGWRA